jgi:hypothetical protein
VAAAPVPAGGRGHGGPEGARAPALASRSWWPPSS